MESRGANCSKGRRNRASFSDGCGQLHVGVNGCFSDAMLLLVHSDLCCMSEKMLAENRRRSELRNGGDRHRRIVEIQLAGNAFGSRRMGSDYRVYFLHRANLVVGASVIFKKQHEPCLGHYVRREPPFHPASIFSRQTVVASGFGRLQFVNGARSLCDFNAILHAGRLRSHELLATARGSDARWFDLLRRASLRQFVRAVDSRNFFATRGRRLSK
jgi:hypothetical protein